MDETISYRVSEQYNFADPDNKYDDGSVYYRIDSDCDCPECGAELAVAYMGDDDIEVIITTRCGWWGHEKRWLARFRDRLSAAMQLLFTGNLKTQGIVYLKGQEHIASFIKALNEGQRKIKIWKKKQ